MNRPVQTCTFAKKEWLMREKIIEHKFLISMFALLLTDHHKRYGSRDSGDTKTFQPSPKIGQSFFMPIAPK